jgi:glycosidase
MPACLVRLARVENIVMCFKRFQILALLVVVLGNGSALAQTTSHISTVYLTGSFNDWTPASSEYRMKLTGDQQYALTHFFRAGQYKFKFALDGDWVRTAGIGPAGVLTQPGSDINLIIQHHGAYSILLDWKSRHWSLEEAKLEAPEPVLRVIGPVELNLPITLDGSESVARPGREITRYEFWQDPKDPVRASLKQARNAPTAEIIMSKPGTYRFWLWVSDGKDSAPQAVTLQPQRSYQLVGDWTAPAPDKPATFMYRVGPTTFEKVLASQKPGDHQLILICDHDAGQIVDSKIISITETNRQFWQVTFDEKKREFPCRPERFVQFVFSPPKQTIESVAVAGSFNEWSPFANPMENQGDGTYIAYLKLEEGTYQYKFVVNGEQWFEDPKADKSLRVDDEHGGFNSVIRVTAAEAASDGETTVSTIQTPEWAKNVVWYEILLDRFRNGSISNDPPHTLPWGWDWYRFAAWEKPADDNRFSNDWYSRRFGGDLQGLMEELPYFRELGVTALYICPVFEALSYHGYDTIDYRHIAPWYGVISTNTPAPIETLDPATWQWTASDKLFLEFVRKAHEQGLKVIIDAVFNHMSKFSFAMQNVQTNGFDSVYADWFDVTDWGSPIKYRSWDKGGWMPNFYKNNQHGIASDTARQHLQNITRRWMDPNGDGDPSDGVDGWRLDVAEDIPAAFWIDWRKVVKSLNPNAIIVAEAWGPIPKRLRGDQWDASMNYPFAIRSVRFFIDKKRRLTPTGFSQHLQQLLDTYPVQVDLVMQNLYDSHDTDRLANMIINPDREYDQHNRPQNGDPYNGAKPNAAAYQVLKLMVTFQMTFPGAPMIWYGDEAGMFGTDDPTNRKPMLWKDITYTNPQDVVMPDIWNHYARLIAIRNTYPALRTGRYETILTDNARSLFGFTRSLSNEVVAVVLNNGTQAEDLQLKTPFFPEGAHIVDLLTAPVELTDTPMLEAGFPNAPKTATVRTLRLGKTTPLVVQEGKVPLHLPAKSAAILVKSP